MEQLCEEKIAELHAALVVLLDGVSVTDQVKLFRPFLDKHALVIARRMDLQSAYQVLNNISSFHLDNINTITSARDAAQRALNGYY